MNLPIGPSDYYETFPPAHHSPGDLWSKLPTHGVLSLEFTPGLIITPACDLLNRKVETATYLPVVSLRTYFTSRSVLPDILRRIDGQAQAARLDLGLCDKAESLLPRADDIVTALQLLLEQRSNSKLTEKETTASFRAEAGLRVISGILKGDSADSSVSMVKKLLGQKEYSEWCRKSVTNAYRSDVHFLPPDDQPPKWSIIQEPSVALFRYPLSVPLDLLDLASCSSEAAWSEEVMRLSALFRCAAIVRECRPLKMLRIRPRFISDVLTRFTGLYGRLGSPDFSQGVVDRYVKLIEDNQP